MQKVLRYQYMKQTPFISIFLFIMLFTSCRVSKNNLDDFLYFGKPRPTNTPLLFAPNIISEPNRHEFGCCFSKNGKEFYFGVDDNGKMEIYYTTLKNGKWTAQENLFPNDSCSYNDPMLSPDEKRLYFISDRPTEEDGTLKDIDIWYIEREGRLWSDPINVGAPINNNLDQYFVSFTKNGTLYFGSKDQTKDAPQYAFDIYKSEYRNRTYLTPEKLPKEINTNRYEADVYIAPDESYMIFCSIRRDGFGIGDLYISFRKEDGSWTDAKNMGASINTDKHELCPFVTADGKYFFYTSNQDIYWVSTEIFEKYK